MSAGRIHPWLVVILLWVVALLNYLLAMSLQPFGWKLTLQELVGWLNAPFAWLMGIRWKDCPLIGQILGERIVLNEFFGYLSLSAQKPFLDERSYVLATYALCGFANLGSGRPGEARRRSEFSGGSAQGSSTTGRAGRGRAVSRALACPTRGST